MEFNNPNEPYMVECSLLDEKGNRAVAQVRKELIYMFERSLKEGEYKQIRNFGTAVDKDFHRFCNNDYKIIFKRNTRGLMSRNFLLVKHEGNMVSALQSSPT
ncbi:OLC1v1018697C1 [Oldenlandia corymbosa var. corymbosa]|uniref:OLC1v1018697C1 n=1 Tax=Oldenlandia corymbosa var. corymbosa TaxID=529605 RepID=A0AAV1ECD8_OLDCO|nr:OLC1v1018697C1 [Oldenlandia corymbosa var. corymbosa]